MPKLSALEGELGELERPDGGVSTEISITVRDPRNPNKFINIPTLVRGQIGVPALLMGERHTPEQIAIATKRAILRTKEGQDLPSYDSIEDAVNAAKLRSSDKGKRRDLGLPTHNQ